MPMRVGLGLGLRVDGIEIVFIGGGRAANLDGEGWWAVVCDPQ